MKLNEVGTIHLKCPHGYDGGSDICGRMWTAGGRQSPFGRPYRKFKFGSTDVHLSSSQAKKLASLLPEFRLWAE